MGMFTKETPHRYILSTEVHRLQLASIYVRTLFPVWTLSSLMPILIYLEPCIFQSCLLWGIWLLLAASNSVSGLSPTRSPRLIPTPLPPCAIFLPFCWSVFLEFSNCISLIQILLDTNTAVLHATLLFFFWQAINSCLANVCRQILIFRNSICNTNQFESTLQSLRGKDTILKKSGICSP